MVCNLLLAQWCVVANKDLLLLLLLCIRARDAEGNAGPPPRVRENQTEFRTRQGSTQTRILATEIYEGCKNACHTLVFVGSVCVCVCKDERYTQCYVCYVVTG